MTQEQQHERSPWSLPLKFQQFEQLQFNKGFPANAQTHLRDPVIESSKGGQVGANQAGKKGEKLR